MKPEHLYKLLSTEQIGSDAWYKIMDDFITEQNRKNVSIRLGEITYDNQWCRHIYYLNKTELHSTELVGISKLCCVSSLHKTQYHDLLAARVTIPYDDMGHSYSSTSTELCVKVDILGTITAVPVTNQKGIYLFYNSLGKSAGDISNGPVLEIKLH